MNRLRRYLNTAVLLLLVVACSGQASAQVDSPRGWYMDIQRFHPSSDTLGGFQLESARTLELWNPAFALHFNYANRALVTFDRTDTSREFEGALVGHLFAMDLQAALGLGFADVSVNIPITLDMANNAGDVAGYPNYDHFSGAGDIRFAVKGRFLDPEKGLVGVGLILPLTLPSGNAHNFNGTYGATFAPQVLVETRPGKFHAALNVGPYLTSSVVYQAPDGVEVIRTGPEFRLGVGAGYRVADPVDLHGELLAGFGLGGDPSPLRNPAEWRVGARIYPHQTLSVDLALGSGLSAGYGSPAFRFLFGVSFVPSMVKDTDRDGVGDPSDLCVDEAEDKDGFEDKDGCPDPDNDGDGVLDEQDQCPEEAETVNQFEDDDGCADDNPDTDGDGLANVDDSCPDQPEDLDGFEDTDGCPDPDNDGDRVLDADDKCPDQQEVYNGKDDLDGCSDEGSLSLDFETGEIKLVTPLNFLSKKAVLQDDAKALLDAVAHVIIARKDLLTVEVQVHTETSGDQDFNERFSDARAQIIRLFLVEKGIDEGRLKAKGYGGSQPIVEGTSKSANEANRRVQFMILDVAE